MSVYRDRDWAWPGKQQEALIPHTGATTCTTRNSSRNSLTGVAEQFATQDQENTTIQVLKRIAVFAMKNAIFHSEFFKITLFCCINFWKYAVLWLPLYCTSHPVCVCVWRGGVNGVVGCSKWSYHFACFLGLSALVANCWGNSISCIMYAIQCECDMRPCYSQAQLSVEVFA